VNIRELRALIEDLDDEVEVRLMTQPNYPFEYSVSGAVTFDQLVDFQINEAQADPDRDEEEPIELFEPASGNDPGYFGRGPYCGSGILYLLEDQQLGYGTSDVWAVDEDLY
jgi:hypothetical protein